MGITYHLRVFRSLCYAHNQRSRGDKFASRSRQCVFVGYPSDKKGWKLFDLDKKGWKFHETEFPYVDVLHTRDEVEGVSSPILVLLF